MSHVQKEYDIIASEYDIKWKEYLDETHSKVLEFFTAKPADTILDISGGTGLLAEKILNRFKVKKFVVADLSEGVLCAAKKNALIDFRQPYVSRTFMI